MSMETLASCAETGQNGAVKISTANNIRFTMRQIDAWREGRQSPKNSNRDATQCGVSEAPPLAVT
jgi:hypothetical protein